MHCASSLILTTSNEVDKAIEKIKKEKIYQVRPNPRL